MISWESKEISDVILYSCGEKKKERKRDEREMETRIEVGGKVEDQKKGRFKDGRKSKVRPLLLGPE